MNIINNSQVLGSPSKDLVLNTLGKVYVRVGDRYYELDFRNTSSTLTEDITSPNPTIENNISESDIVITKSISDLEYPGDDKFVISLDGKFYVTKKGRYKNVTPSKDNTSENLNNLTITSLTDVNVIGQLYSDGLIIDFLSNKITAGTISVDKISANSIDVKNFNISSNDTFVSGSGKLYIGPELSVHDTDVENDLVYFYIKSEFDTALFPKHEYVTDNTESFICEIVEVQSNCILCRLISGEIDSPSKIILKGDCLRYDSKWKSFYDKTYNLRFNHISESGDYSDLELATVNSDVSVQLKPGTLLKCLSDCTIDATVNGVANQYQLYKNVLYLVNETKFINLTDSIRYFKTKQEFNEADHKTIDVAFIEDTEQIYYNGLLVGGKQESSLPDNFKIEDATTGAIIVKKDGVWQPSYDYVTTQYVTDKVNDLLDNVPDALNTFNKIAIVVQNNANRIDEIYRLLGSTASIDELNAKLDEINSQLDAIDINNIITVLDDKASWAYVKNLEAGLSEFATKAWVESALETYLKSIQNNTSNVDISNIQTAINRLQSKLNEYASAIDTLKVKNADISNSIQALTDDYNKLNTRVDELEHRSDITTPGSSEALLGGFPVKVSELVDGHTLIYSDRLKAWINKESAQDVNINDLFEIDGTGNLHIKHGRGLWSDSFITAGGINANGNSGATYDRLDEWSDYTADKAGYVLSAKLGKELYDDVQTLKTTPGGIDQNELSSLLDEWQYLKWSDANKYYAPKQSTEARLTELEKMWEIVDGNIHAKNNMGVYSDSFITAGGVNNSESSGGVSAYERLDDWSKYSETNGDVLSAYLGKGLLDRIGTLESKVGNTAIDLSKYVTITSFDGHLDEYNKHKAKFTEHVNSYSEWKTNVDSIIDWFEVVNGNIHVKTGLYTDSFLTAGGINGSSGGSSYGRLDNWSNYSSTSGDVLSATLGYDLYTRVKTLETTGGGGSDEPIDLSDYVTKSMFTTHVNAFNNHVTAYSSHETAFNNHVTAYNKHVENYTKHVENYNKHIENYNAHVTTYTNHITDYNAHVTDYSTFKSSYTTWKGTVDKVLKYLEIDSSNNLHIKTGAYADKFLTAGGVNGSTGTGMLRLDAWPASWDDKYADYVLSAKLGWELHTTGGSGGSGGSYTLPAASTTELGGIKLGYSSTGKNYPVKLDANNKAYVSVPWVGTDSQASQSSAGLMSATDKKKLDGIAEGANKYTYTLPQATTSTLGGVKIGTNITVNSGTISLSKANVTNALGYTPPTTNTTYNAATTSTAGLMSAADKIKLNGIADGANKYTYTLPNATSSTLGGVKIGNNITVSSGTISLSKDNVTTALGYTPPTSDTNTWRTVQCNGTSIGNNTLNLKPGSNISLSNSSGAITITATDTNTTYSAGTGLSLSSTTFSVKYGTAAGTACQGNDSRLSDSRPASDVYAWAKAASKPSYKTSEVTEQTNLYFTNARAISALTNATLSGNLTATGIITGQTDVVAGSDIRYKTIVDNINADINILKAIAEAPLFTYTWNNRDNKDLHLGTSAQYWEKTVFKHAVKFDKSKDFKYLSYQTLAFGIGKINSSILIKHDKALSEQDKRILELENKVEYLESELNKYKYGCE